MGSSTTATLGRDAENLAFDFLQNQGLTPIARNFRTRGGEIDLIMLSDSCLVFVEVRYRSSTRFTTPHLTVDIHKQRKLIRAAALFAVRYPQYADACMRFDVVAIDGVNGEPSCHWIRDAFRPADSTL